MPSCFRFAPSPNGDLHLGHAFSALLNGRTAMQLGGRLLVRIEDLDAMRARPHFAARILSDLDWLGIAYERPVFYQSAHQDAYRAALMHLDAMGLTYHSFLSRAEIRDHIAAEEARAGRPWPRDPDGAPLFPGERVPEEERARRIASGVPFSIRLNMQAALARIEPLSWQEFGEGDAPQEVAADPALWGDIILARKDAPASYHLAVVVDDARQGVTDVMRGADLFPATHVQRLLQQLLGLPVPRYRHHRLILDEAGRKLSKSRTSTSLSALRDTGVTAEDVRRRLGF